MIRRIKKSKRGGVFLINESSGGAKDLSACRSVCTLIFVFLFLPVISTGQIIADHTIIEMFDDIPQYYIDKVRRMWVTVPGESHSEAYRRGLELLESMYPDYPVNVVETGIPEAYTDQYLRVSRATWGDYNNSTGWIYSYGEEDWWTNSLATERTKAGIDYCNTNGFEIAATGFGWCWDANGGTPSAVDPVYQCRWYGLLLPAESHPWGLDDGDNILTGSTLNMNTYIAVTRGYDNYCRGKGYPTRVFLTTGPVDTYTGEDGYQAYLKWNHLREYAASDADAILFDYADILCYNDDGTQNLAVWNGHTYPLITGNNLGDASIGHIGEAGAVRLAKAIWWMLARMAGWDGEPETYTAGTWVGGVSGYERDWNVAQNWFGGVVPGPDVDVSIYPSAEFQPVLAVAPGGECRSLTVKYGASLAIEKGNALTVNGNLAVAGLLTVESDFTSSGSLTVAGTCSGNITYNRAMPAGDAWHYISSPVTPAVMPAGSFYGWNEVSGLWDEDPASVVASGAGYALRTTGNTVTFTGQPADSPTVQATSPYVTDYVTGTFEEYESRIAREPFGGGGWNLLGNPYTSALRIGGTGGFLDVNDGDGSIADCSFDPNYVAVYLFDGITGTYYYRGLTVDFPDPVINETPENRLFESENIQVGQGFFVLAMKNGVNFNFTKSMQVHDISTIVVKSSSGQSDSWPGIRLIVKASDSENSALVVFNDRMTAGLDPGYDVGLFRSGADVEVYTVLASKDNNVSFTRQALPEEGSEEFVIPVGVDLKNGGRIIFSAQTVPLRDLRFWLEDRETGAFTDLSSGGYQVSLPEGSAGTGRFYLYVRGENPGDNAGEENVPVIWASERKIMISGITGVDFRGEVFDLNGHKILESPLILNELNSLSLPDTAGGLFLVRVSDGSRVYTKKIIMY